MENAQNNRCFVLVAGAGHGGWAWQRVADILSAQGHQVFRPSLTGLADRSHLLSESVRLGTHILDIVNLCLWENLANVVLVGHSYAGWVISGAVEHLEDRVSAIAFVDAFLPDSGQRGYDLLNPQQKADFDAAMTKGEVSRPGPTSTGLRIQNVSDATWVDSKVTAQPLGVSLDAISLTGARERIKRKLYIRTPLFPQPRFDDALKRCAKDPTWQTIAMEGCGHDPMIDRPEELAMHLLALIDESV